MSDDGWELFGADSDEEHAGQTEIGTSGATAAARPSAPPPAASSPTETLEEAYQKAWERFLHSDFPGAVDAALPWIERLTKQPQADADGTISEADLCYIAGAAHGASPNDPELLDRALGCYDAHLRLVPENLSARRMRAETLLRRRRYADALRAFDDVAEKNFAHFYDRYRVGEADAEVTPFRLRHDANQWQHLARVRRAVAGEDRDLPSPHDQQGRREMRRVAAALEAELVKPGLFFDDAVSREVRRTVFSNLPEEARRAIDEAYYTRPALGLGRPTPALAWRYAELEAAWGAAAPEDVLNPALDWRSIQDAFDMRGVVVIDDLLSPGALAELQRYSRIAPVFHTMRNGFLGAFPGDGFSHPLVGTLASAMESAFGEARFAAHPLGLFWLFKYTTSNPRGIGLHADPAAINLNLWLTPDAAHVAGGGLDVYDTVPEASSLGDVNREFASRAEEAELEATLRQQGMISVPYRCNRAVLFVSDRYHRSQEFEFRDGFPNHRVNLTLLWGDRLGARTGGEGRFAAEGNAGGGDYV